jgi:hypothetical protein
MIKEDHLLACTTKMFEILVRQSINPKINQLTSWIAQTTEVHLSSWTHTLAACPTIHLSKSSDDTSNFRQPCRIPSLVRRLLSGVPDWGGESYRSFCDCQPVSQTFLLVSSFRSNCLLGKTLSASPGNSLRRVDNPSILLSQAERGCRNVKGSYRYNSLNRSAAVRSPQPIQATRVN